MHINEAQVSGVWLAMCSLAFYFFLSLPVLHGLAIDKSLLISLRNEGLVKGSLEILKGPQRQWLQCKGVQWPALSEVLVSGFASPVDSFFFFS